MRFDVKIIQIEFKKAHLRTFFTNEIKRFLFFNELTEL